MASINKEIREELALRKQQQQVNKAVDNRLKTKDDVKDRIAVGNKFLTTQDYQELKVCADFVSAVVKTSKGAPFKFKAQSEGTDTAGGYAVPTEFNNQLVRAEQYVTGLYQDVRQLTLNNQQMTINLQDNNLAVSKVAEGAAAGEQNFVLSQITLTLYKYGFRNIQSYELLSDQNMSPNTIQLVIEEGVMAHALNKDKQLIEGDGNSDPQGILALRAVDTDNTPAKLLLKIPVALLGAKGTVFNTWSPANIRKIIRSLDPGYREGNRGQLCFIMGTDVLDEIASYADDKDYHYLQINRNVDPQGIGRFTLMGYPVYDFNNATLNAKNNKSAVATNSKAGTMFFGRRDHLVHAMSNNPRRVDTDSGGKYFDNDQTCIRILERYTNAVLQKKAWIQIDWDAS